MPHRSECGGVWKKAETKPQAQTPTYLLPLRRNEACPVFFLTRLVAANVASRLAVFCTYRLVAVGEMLRRGVVDESLVEA